MRYVVVGITALAALWMYVDRVCFSTLKDTIQADLSVAPERMNTVLGAFFFAYAIFQIPVGGLADRYGPKLILSLCVVGWSLATAATSLANGYVGLLSARLLLGVTEAGAFPAATGLVRRWAAPGERGLFSSIVTLGGRLGGAAAPFVTAWLALALSGLPGDGEKGASNWRGVFLLYGGSGLLVAALLWLWIEDRPAGSTQPADGHALGWIQLLELLVKSRNLWLSSGTQLCVNVGWAFLVTLMPTYLETVFNLPLQERGRMQSVTLVAGCVGMLMGGFLTDAIRRRLGPRLGRALPMGICLAGCAVASGICPSLSTPWGAVAALSVMAFLVDMKLPSLWSFNQDIGGRFVSAAAGWGNMWGNLGAALSPVLLGWLSREGDWSAAFYACAGFFACGSVCGFLMDASRPLEAAAKDLELPAR